MTIMEEMRRRSHAVRHRSRHLPQGPFHFRPVLDEALRLGPVESVRRPEVSQCDNE
jgi:hypothetical protein